LREGLEARLQPPCWSTPLLIALAYLAGFGVLCGRSVW